MATTTALKKVVLVGASGNLGAIILPALLESNALEVTVLTRASSSAAFPPDVAVIKTAYSEADLVKALQGQDAVISAVGAAGFQSQKTLIDASIKAGVKRFIPSEFSSNTLSDTVRQLVPVFEAKKQILDYLKDQEGSGLSWTGLATGLLLDWGLQSGFLGFDIANKKAVLWDGGNVLFSATNRADIGKAVVSIFQHPSETANKYLYTSTVTTSQSAILKSLEEHTAHSWTVDKVKSEEQTAKGRQLVSEGNFTGMFLLVQASGYGAVEGIRCNYAAEERLANADLGLPVEGSLDETVKAVLQSSK
ncbi:hypothetical protein A1O3_01545 [Capronia epimyces CBS 606.96]|uniref:NmrA-like domain-containing protein n=1 Tax=Capronia epimyces CBS 606.96 TaxID=1182542 RepID=W9ZER0_9EURO|nr:uncharacterized protein A1O3_01545 [Capronia epimyces CBS 606.96]EXJ92989.1 hypothetical protein A1O3_01545 [Capronia epimyces CBS 606.96]